MKIHTQSSKMLSCRNFLGFCSLSALLALTAISKSEGQEVVFAPNIGQVKIKELQNPATDGAPLLQEIREFSANAGVGETWIPLGRFRYGTTHRLEISCDGHSGNSSGVVEFSSAWSGVAYASKIEQYNYQNRFIFYTYKVGNYTGVAMKYKSSQNGNSVRVKHTCVEGRWADHQPDLAFLNTLTEANRLKANIANYSGSSYPADGLTRGIHFSQKAYFNQGAEIGGSPVLTRNSGGVASSTGFAGGTGAKATGADSIAYGKQSQATGNYSSAFGGGSIASGDFSFAAQTGKATNYASTALGAQTSASGRYAFAAGRSNFASGDTATAMGIATRAEGTASTAIGQNSKAYGDWSFAGGYQSEVRNRMSFAYGYYSKAEGGDPTNSSVSVKNGGAFAFGSHAHAIGYSTFASGSSARATAPGAIAMGWSPDATAAHSVAIGPHAQTSANYAVSLGHSATSSEEHAVALGYQTKATAVRSLATGYKTQALGHTSSAHNHESISRGNFSSAFGVRSIASSYGQFVVGVDNKDLGGTLGARRSSDALFVVGNGTGPGVTQRRNAFEVRYDGSTTMKGDAAVEGDTIMKGDVTMTKPQGDISMGNFGG